MRKIPALVALVAAAALALSSSAAASATGVASKKAPAPRVWSTEVGAPFSLAVDGKRVLVADGGTGAISQLQRDGSLEPLVEGVPDLAGLAVRGGWMAYGSTVVDEASGTHTAAGLNIRSPRGDTVYADILGYEESNNPDGAVHYGVENPSACVAEAFNAAGFPVDYTGIVDAHPYSVASWHGKWLVADAGSNAIYTVTDSGRVSTLAVLPAQSATITAEAAAMFGMPDCVIGVSYAFEAVPTSVTIGRNDAILVSTLPGGPEDSSLGARGAVWEVNPRTGAVKSVASGLAAPTSIAAGKDAVYVAEFGAGRISKVRDGEVSQVVSLPGALSVATGSDGTLWAATMASESGSGSIVSISGGKVKVQGHWHDGGHRDRGNGGGHR
ncbi:ScyD/ScyE family protein [Microbacterium oryzae]|uniref:ScyD/ScyE family protein n=1 Tax=Microbacterium oryzae TaxID=743009 RepID=UPI0025AEE87A|nr:ScyD/ScyE family protein [Microbacterium oryzae]MDN3309807.1 ScyD/ScyE family protein [Microbacterium oryzae]